MKSVLQMVYNYCCHDKGYLAYNLDLHLESERSKLYNYWVMVGTITEKQAQIYEKWLTDYVNKLKKL